MREAASLMCDRKEDMTFKEGVILSKSLDSRHGACAKQKAKAWIQGWGARFEKILGQYRGLDFENSIKLLRQEALSVSSSPNILPFPTRAKSFENRAACFREQNSLRT
ncbi:MAG: hypothetical protein EOM37_04895 [Proteobacteria bacterium]|nr:hypothetical protein [Alphaproteobacteria bacterium]NCC03370.1 hypothetical protein [Pseudomonadota bacterium]